MTREQWQRVRELFERALDAEPADAAAWLSREAGGDEQVRAEVESLLRHHTRAGSFLSQPLSDHVPDLLAEDRELQPGQVVGSYTIVREVGRGGMGRVYLATDARLGRTVALKALPPELTADPTQRERLRREARAAAALTHPGICTVYALEELDGELFIATEYVEGHTLREEIGRSRRPSARDVLNTGREIAAALAGAHSKGVTHRDLKPENIMRATDGRLKILDFGLARIDTASAAAGPRVTQTGALVGTPAYMAPEQINGQAVDARVDVFAFGVLMYEYACGVHPFEASTPLAVIARVLESDVRPIESRCPDLPWSLVRVIDRCLRKIPAERPASAVELVQALSRDDGAGVPRARVTNWWRTHQIVVVGLYFLASALAWRVKEWHQGVTASMFLTIGIAATVAGVFRGHLVFTESMNGRGLTAQRRRAAPVTLVMDLVIALALVVDGVIMSETRPLVSVLTIGLAVGIALAKIVVEPSTTAAAFGEDDEQRRDR